MVQRHDRLVTVADEAVEGVVPARRVWQDRERDVAIQARRTAGSASASGNLEQGRPVDDVPQEAAGQHAPAEAVAVGVGGLLGVDGQVRVLVGQPLDVDVEAGRAEAGDGLAAQAGAGHEPEGPVARVVVDLDQAKLLGPLGVAGGRGELALVADVHQQAGQGPVQGGRARVRFEAPRRLAAA